MEKRYYKHNKEFSLECGATIKEIEICYHISKEFNSTKISNNVQDYKPVIWITHALTANSDPTEWWDTLVGRGKFFDPSKYTVVCANVIGSCYGSTCGASYNPESGKPYMLDFPRTTVRDIVKCHEILRVELGIESIDLLIGGSVGGFQAIEWSIISPDVIKNLALLACGARISPWANAFNESQRMTLYSDRTLEQQQFIKLEKPNECGYIYEPTGGKAGLAAARSIALISYRSYRGYDTTQMDEENALFTHRAESYQRYQGAKLANRFDAYSYLTMINLSDTHNIGRDRGGIEVALKLIKARVLCIGIDSDFLFPTSEQKEIANGVKNGTLTLISSTFGHDGFLLEWEQIKNAIIEWDINLS